MAAFELATASDADVDDGPSSWPTVPTLRQRSSTYRRSRKAGLKVHRDVYGRIVDSAATLGAQRQPLHAPLVNDCARSNKSRQKRLSDLQAHE